ncbi:hypothetical protein [Hylemonella gracilis]|nr:hypothetical protein [Hylemonella gracilis]
MQSSKKKSDSQGEDRGARENFSSATRASIAKAAGEKCSFRGCLAPTSTVAEKSNGKAGSTDIATASHIYAAAPGGPRPAPPGMSPEQIRDQSNGIWTCGVCAGRIDRREPVPSAEDLIEMKRVRETAQRMAVMDPQLSFASSYISPREWDEVFWQHLPDLDPESIRTKLLDLAAKSILRITTGGPNQSLPHFPITPLTRDIRAGFHRPANESGNEAFIAGQASKAPPISLPHVVADASAKRRATQIFRAWALRYPGGAQNGLILHVNVQIGARNPKTGEVSSAFIQVLATGHIQSMHAGETGEQLTLKLWGTTDRINDLEWKLDVSLDQGKIESTSTLRRIPWRLFDSFKNGFPDLLEELERYESVVRLIMQGWEPVGYVDVKADSDSYGDQMHPDPFDIDLQVDQATLSESLQRCQKIRLALDLERVWGGRMFSWRDAYFEKNLTPELILCASNELKDRHVLRPREGVTSLTALIPEHGREIHFKVSPLAIYFEYARSSRRA